MDEDELKRELQKQNVNRQITIIGILTILFAIGYALYLIHTT